MTRAGREAGGVGVVAGERHPFSGVVRDTLWVDKDQSRVFATVGATRGLFDGVAGWPDLNRLVAERSAEVQRDQGRDAWVEVGGAYDDDGCPTLQARSPLGLAIVRDIAENPGRLRWTDPAGVGWAVRLVRRTDAGPGAYFGFAVTLPGVARAVDSTTEPAAVGYGRRHGGGVGRPARADPGGRRLRLYERAEQALWFLHANVLAQRRSDVRLPDVMMGQAVWGGRRGDWPRDWRGDLFDVLGSLTWLHASTLRLDERSWQPRFSSHSVGVSHAEDLRATRPHADVCDPSCPMWGSGEAHGHFLVEVGYGFLGVLEGFVAGGGRGGRRAYDFTRRPTGEAGRELRAAERAGGLVTVSLPAKVFGSAAWSGLGPSHRRVIDGLVAEVSRGRKGGSPDRTDRAAVLVGDVVPGARPRLTATCPYLRPGGRYVTFGGNGRRAGMGYRVVGADGRGWLEKCGYAPPAGADGLPRVARAFLADLAHVAGLLGLTVVGFDPRGGYWFDLGGMRALAGTGAGWRRLDSVHLRVYAPEDYLDRLRGHFASRGRFASIPGSVAEVSAPRGALDLATRMRLAGVTQRRLAERLGVSQAFVSKVLSGKSPWPAGLVGQAEGFVAGVEAGG